MAALFNPRAQRWEDHFGMSEDYRIVGKTATGRASVELLRMNRPVAVEIRQWLARQGLIP